LLVVVVVVVVVVLLLHIHAKTSEHLIARVRSVFARPSVAGDQRSWTYPKTVSPRSKGVEVAA
jgi:hypothetical protein